MGIKIKKNPNFDKEFRNKVIAGLDRMAIVLQTGIKNELSLHSSPSNPGQSPGVKTGALRRSIQIDRSKISQLRVRVGSNLIYARIQEFGGIITPKNKKVLRFKIGDRWVIAQKVILPPRPYLRPALKKTKKTMISEFNRATK